jgi:hypothetical protein
MIDETSSRSRLIYCWTFESALDSVLVSARPRGARHRLFLAPAERADVIVEFSGQSGCARS